MSEPISREEAELLERVEAALGMGFRAWDTLEPAEVVRAFLATVPAWVPVSERGPEENVAVLVSAPVTVNGKRYTAYAFAFYDSGTWYTADLTFDWLVNGYPLSESEEVEWDITHWMPLPAAPEGTK